MMFRPEVSPADSDDNTLWNRRNRRLLPPMLPPGQLDIVEGMPIAGVNGAFLSR
jgi:hypothetical protein